MTNISTDVLVKRRLELLAEIDRLNVRINEIERWLQIGETGYRLDRDPPAGYLGAGVVGAPISPTVVQARNPRKINKVAKL